MSDYVPIDCNFYDRLESAAVRGATHALAYVTAEGASVRAEARILDVFSRDRAEFVRLDDDTTVRLDRIASLDGIERPGASSCGDSDGSC